MAAHFSPAAVKFLRALKRNNDREWFNARKPLYEAELKAPMLAVIAAVNQHLLRISPAHVRAPEKCLMRIYRDIRFSPNKLPYKTNVAAWWSRQGLEKTSGGGFYVELSPTGLTIAAGVYMPEREQLLAIRRMLLDRFEDYNKLVRSKKLLRLLEPFDGLKMTRGPKGFPPDHPAMDLILQRQWGVSATLPVEAAFSPDLVEQISQRFKAAEPLVTLLNEPLLASLSERSKKPLF